MRVTDIIWDWNGTLLDDTKAALDTLNAMLARRGAPPVAMDFYRDNFGFPVRPFYARIGMDLEHEDWDALAQEYHDIYITQPRCLNAHALEALQLAAEHGVRQSIASALRQDLLEEDLAQFGIRGYFAFAYGTDNLDGASKLSRAKDLMTALGNPAASSTFVIGDAFHDKEVADALGVGCVLHGEGSHAAWRLRRRATTVETIADAVRLLVGGAI